MKTKDKKKLFLLFIIVHIFFYGLSFFTHSLNQKNILSFEIAFFSSLLIIIISYFNYQKNIVKNTYKYKFDQIPNIFIKNYKKDQKIIKFKKVNDDLKLNFKDKIQNFTLFFTLFKLLAYGILVAGFLFLNRKGIFSTFAYLGGISALLICIIIFALCVKYEFNKNY
ncbi:hypothetical protein JG676_03630 [Campylobacter sp. 2018MI35]|uniref:hypothetical protein n=1 Tax=Campylobacter sp. 2018MI34 TaxID=2800582 RepID=UPI0019060FE8|nr:hypothetical protein [Campylobacter sp. 2018MI34]MBK1991688.1 hypothetical protein [Campylobacter sp. 2018MI34]